MTYNNLMKEMHVISFMAKEIDPNGLKKVVMSIRVIKGIGLIL